MENTKMTRVAKTLDVLANVGGKVSFAAGITCLVIAVLALIFGDKMFTSGALTLDLDFVKFHLSDQAATDARFLKLYVCVSTFGGSVLCFLAACIAKLMRKIIQPMTIGRPFEKGTPESMREVGWAILLGGFLNEVIGVLARTLLIKAYSLTDLFSCAAITKTEFVFTMNLDFVFLACVIFLLSYIFTYGQVLQKDADETL